MCLQARAGPQESGPGSLQASRVMCGVRSQNATLTTRQANRSEHGAACRCMAARTLVGAQHSQARIHSEKRPPVSRRGTDCEKRKDTRRDGLDRGRAPPKEYTAHTSWAHGSGALSSSEACQDGYNGHACHGMCHGHGMRMHISCVAGRQPTTPVISRTWRVRCVSVAVDTADRIAQRASDVLLVRRLHFLHVLQRDDGQCLVGPA